MSASPFDGTLLPLDILYGPSCVSGVHFGRAMSDISLVSTYPYGRQSIPESPSASSSTSLSKDEF